MGKLCLHASSFILDRIFFKVSGNHQNRHKSSVEFDFGPNQTAQYWVTCPWVTKISHFWTSISLKPVGQSWSNFICSVIGVGERLHKVLGQIDLGTLDSAVQSLPFGLLVTEGLQVMKRQVPSSYHCKIVARLYHDQKSLSLDRLYCNSMQELLTGGFLRCTTTPIWIAYKKNQKRSTGPDSSVGRVSAPGNGRSRVRSRAATYQSR